MMRRTNAIILLIFLSFLPGWAQKRQRIPVCRAATFAAFKSLPELSYECPEGSNDSDDKILTLPERLAALTETANELKTFTDARWWQADVDELNACDLRGKVGGLSSEEQEKYTGGEYQFRLFGNNSVRLVLLNDPCYQTGYSGSVAFLLHRSGGGVSVTKVIDGYYSRIDNSVGFDFANLNGQQIIEVSTANNMPPSVRNYYFVIDPKTHRAVPKNLFKTGATLTNEIDSAMIIGEPGELGLPRGSEDMQIITRNHLRPSFNVYTEDFSNGGDGHKLKRTVYRWNGKFYVAAKAGVR